MTRSLAGRLLTFAAVLSVIVLISALLAPLLYAVLPFPFPRIFDRLLMIGAIVAFVAFVRMRRETIEPLGMAWAGGSAGLLRRGFATGFVALAIFALVSVATGHARAAVRDLSALQWAWRFALACFTGLVVGLVEEVLFRGFLFTRLRKSFFRGRALPAAMLTSFLFFVVHVQNVRRPPAGPDPGFADGMRQVLAFLQSVAAWPDHWPSVVGLFLFGMVLNLAVIRSGTLWPAIGLHAGCVAFLRLTGLFVRFDPANTWLWSTRRVYDGAAGWAFLLLAGFLLIARLRRDADTP